MALDSLVRLDHLRAFKPRCDDELKSLEDVDDNIKFHSKICVPPFSEVGGLSIQFF